MVLVSAQHLVLSHYYTSIPPPPTPPPPSTQPPPPLHFKAERVARMLGTTSLTAPFPPHPPAPCPSSLFSPLLTKPLPPHHISSSHLQGVAKLKFLIQCFSIGGEGEVVRAEGAFRGQHLDSHNNGGGGRRGGGG